jgi:hypothetical protein
MRKYKLPKDSLVEPEEGQQPGDGFIDGQDVEGHGLPTTAPPSIDPQRDTSHGGEAVASDEPNADRTD